MILQARWVKKPRKVYRCEDCGAEIGGPHLYLYGAAETYDKPFPVRFCEGCTDGLVERAAYLPSGEDKKILTAVEKRGQTNAEHDTRQQQHNEGGKTS